MKRLTKILLIASVLLMTQAACILQAYVESRQPSFTVEVTPNQSNGSSGPQMGATAYPSSPEEVVSGFILASQDDPALMVQFLSPARQQTLPDEGPFSILDIDAPIQGYTIKSAAVSPEPPAATVEVIIQAGGRDLTRTFQLTQTNGFWFIESVDITD